MIDAYQGQGRSKAQNKAMAGLQQITPVAARVGALTLCELARRNRAALGSSAAQHVLRSKCSGHFVVIRLHSGHEPCVLPK
jgi:hypothetical protein